MTKIEELINESMIQLDLEAKNKNEILEKVSKLISENGNLVTPDEIGAKSIEEVEKGFLDALNEREKVFSTAVGYSFAIPHGKTDFVGRSAIAYARLTEEVDWSDEEKVRHIFMIGVPEKNAGNEHLEILIKLSTAILEDEFRETLEKVKNKAEVMELLKKYANRERTV